MHRKLGLSTKLGYTPERRLMANSSRDCLYEAVFINIER